MCAVESKIATVVITSVVALLVFLMAFDPHGDHNDVNSCEQIPTLDVNSQGAITGQVYVKFYTCQRLSNMNFALDILISF